MSVKALSEGLQKIASASRKERNVGRIQFLVHLAKCTKLSSMTRMEARL